MNELSAQYIFTRISALCISSLGTTSNPSMPGVDRDCYHRVLRCNLPKAQIEQALVPLKSGHCTHDSHVSIISSLQSSILAVLVGVHRDC